MKHRDRKQHSTIAEHTARAKASAKIKTRILLAMFVVFAPISGAQEAANSKPPATEQAAPAAEKATPGDSDNTPAKPAESDDVFKPSEEISEDLSVSFPVDI